MRRSMIRRWALRPFFGWRLKMVRTFSAEIPPGPKWLQTGGILSDLSPKLLRSGIHAGHFTRALLKTPARTSWRWQNAADFQPLYAETNKYPFVYLRAAGKERIIVAINPAERACTATLSEVIKSARFRPLLVRGATFHDGYLEMDPISFGSAEHLAKFETYIRNNANHST